MIHKVFAAMMLKVFLFKYPEGLTDLKALQVNCLFNELTYQEWNTTTERADTMLGDFQVYNKDILSFDYWNTYASELFQIIRDLANALCSGNSILYLSAVEGETSLFFFFG